MHLALIINSLGIGGAERILVRLAHEWADRGYKISFITFFQETSFNYRLNTEHNNITLINLGEKKINNNLCSQIIKITKRIIILRKLFIKLKPNAIISFLVGANINCLLANICLNIPIIVSERIDPNKHIIPVFYKLLRIVIYKLANAIIVQTKQIKDYFPRCLQQQIFVIPNWVKEPKIKKILNHDKAAHKPINKIIAIGRLDHQKNHQLLIRAFAILSDKYPNLTLHIYGEGILRNELQNLLTSFNLQDSVKLPGITMDVETNLKDADLFVFPSIYEGFPNALCEAMAVGLPVIASDCSGSNEIVEHNKNGLLFNVGNLEELVKCMEKVINDPVHAHQLAVNAQHIINKFNELKILTLWEQTLEKILPSNDRYVNINHFGRDGREA